MKFLVDICFHHQAFAVCFHDLFNSTHTKWNTTPQLAEGIMVDLWRDFWIRETGTGQQMAQLHDRYSYMMMMNFIKRYLIYMTATFQILWNYTITETPTHTLTVHIHGNLYLIVSHIFPISLAFVFILGRCICFDWF